MTPRPATAPTRPLADPAVRRVAIVRLRVGLGDLLASVPALRALRRHRPDVHVTVITWPEVAPVLDRQAAYVDDLLPFPGHAGIAERPPRPRAWPAFVASCHDRRFDLAIQMYGGQAAANAVTAAVGARRTAGFFTPGEVDVPLATHMPYPTRRHEVDRHLDLVGFLGTPDDDRRLEFPVTSDDRAEADDLLRRHGLVCGEFAVLHPGATAPSRRWPPERFAAVADGLARRGIRVVLTGVAAEAPITAAVTDHTRSRPVDLTGATSLGSLASLLRRSAVLVGNDTGTAHLAAAVGVPSVTIFQSGDRRRWAARDEHRHRGVEAGVACQPCPHQRCPIDLRCAAGVDADDVLRPALDLLSTAETPWNT